MLDGVPVVCFGTTGPYAYESSCHYYNKTINAWTLFGVKSGSARAMFGTAPLNGGLWVSGGIGVDNSYQQYFVTTETVYLNGTFVHEG